VIQIGDAGWAVPAGVLRSPGGFAWWYVDLVTPAGDGAVLIWSYGLPFLPGYAGSARAGSAPMPVERPSVNLAVYRAGKPAFYLLQEHPPSPVDERRLTAVQEIGGCRFARSLDGGVCTVSAVLDCALPGTDERLTGTVRVDGAARRPENLPPDEGAPHLWTPLTGPARGSVELAVGGKPLVRMAGRAYHDRNHGRVPLHALGIARWMWGRVPLAGRERIYYLLWPENPRAAPVTVGLDVGEDGATEEVALAVELGDERREFGGLMRPERIVLKTEDGGPWLAVEHARTVDAGPFYLRLLSRGTAEDGEQALGWGELCVPARVDLPAHRPFVRMRVHHAAGGNSRWLPLFTGPREGRAARLLRHFFSAAR
jgi:carotenoid 1,2-hydratase